MTPTKEVLASSPLALEMAKKLLEQGFWPIAIYPPGRKLGGTTTRGKEPVGKDWGTERWTFEKLRDCFNRFPNAGIGICFGPGRGPEASWLIDLEGDGPAAADSLRQLFADEVPRTMGWKSTRGDHCIFSADGKQLLELLAAAGATEGKGVSCGVWHLADFPDLEIRVGGYHADGSVKQLQSVVPPTAGREWNGLEFVAELPDAAIASLEAIAERLAKSQADQANHEANQGGVSSNGHGLNGSGSNGNSANEIRIIDYLAKLEPAISGQKGHSTLMRAAAVPVRFGVEDPREVVRLLLPYNDRCQPPWTEKDLLHKAEEACKKEKRRDLVKARSTVDMSTNTNGKHRTIKVKEGPDDPHRLARIFKNKHTDQKGVSTMIFYRGEFHRWNGSAYHPVQDYEVSGELTTCIKTEFDRLNLRDIELWEASGQKGKDGKSCVAPVAHQVTRKLVGNVDQALKGIAMVKSEREPPVWLIDDPPFPADGVLPTRNALIHIQSFVEGKENAIVVPTPNFFSTYALDYDFDPKASEPNHLYDFLESIWPADDEQKRALQEWIGYLLTPDTSQQKIAILMGPPRSGKGTITRLIRALIGNQNVAGPTLSGLSNDFGLSTMIGKPVAIVADAKVSKRSDAGVIVERLLNVSGEDIVDVNRKNKDPWTGKLPTRLMMLANELPRLPDVAGALASRFLMFRFRKSFIGKEDRELDSRLRSQLPGVLLWAMEGRRRLSDRGKFLQPESARSYLQQIKDLNSPVGLWVQERVNVGPGSRVDCKVAFADWKQWCMDNNIEQIGTTQQLSSNLSAVVPEIDTKQHRTGKKEPGTTRQRDYIGIELKVDF